MKDSAYDTPRPSESLRRSGADVDVELRPERGVAIWRRGEHATDDDFRRKIATLTTYNNLTKGTIGLKHIRILRAPPAGYDPSISAEVDLAEGEIGRAHV